MPPVRKPTPASSEPPKRASLSAAVPPVTINPIIQKINGAFFDARLVGELVTIEQLPESNEWAITARRITGEGLQLVCPKLSGAVFSEGLYITSISQTSKKIGGLSQDVTIITLSDDAKKNVMSSEARI